MGKGARNRELKQKNKFNVKDMIYVDEITLNSVLAQLDNGLLSAIELTTQTISGIDSSKGKTEKTNGELSANGLFAKGSLTGEKGHNSLLTDIERNMSQKVMKTVYNDHAINILEKKLRNIDKIKHISSSNEGDFIKVSSKFELFNPESLEKIISLLTSNEPLFEKMFGIDSEAENIKLGLKLVSHLDENFINGTFINLTEKNTMVITNKESYRINDAQLQTIQLRKSKITVLGIVESIVSSDMLGFDMDKSLDSMDDRGIMSFFTQNFSNKFNLFILENLGLVKAGTKFIKPIAIYFE
ncbi:hypothetical protein GTO87_05970 [Ligilactobacillus saerimneri]|uniref:Uncharacterized protein n=1 Tax=Ligilactobacillus saerimneri TaxID=228229 RepID=A0A7H9ELN3_9LACO|nr:hypothetical protein [Ligilactobacillus saerimneri]QLL77743.1 hypothetical protein GTO87_03485 [Ligilactobacillus saerimneri]QLL78187.1 hypothetical protein GTO87_05970 [Ligilactobacillus saerimneri]